MGNFRDRSIGSYADWTLQRSEDLQRLLTYLTEKSLAEGADQLKEYAIGMDVFGKGKDYHYLATRGWWVEHRGQQDRRPRQRPDDGGVHCRPVEPPFRTNL